MAHQGQPGAHGLDNGAPRGFGAPLTAARPGEDAPGDARVEPAAVGEGLDQRAVAVGERRVPLGVGLEPLDRADHAGSGGGQRAGLGRGQHGHAHRGLGRRRADRRAAEDVGTQLVPPTVAGGAAGQGHRAGRVGAQGGEHVVGQALDERDALAQRSEAGGVAVDPAAVKPCASGATNGNRSPEPASG